MVCSVVRPLARVTPSRARGQDALNMLFLSREVVEVPCIVDEPEQVLERFWVPEQYIE